jgi:hypothetical protein
MRTILLRETQIGAEVRASEPLTLNESEEKEKKTQTELEEWANKVQKEAVEAAAAMGGELKLSSKESLEVRLKQISDEVTRKVQEHLHEVQKAKPSASESLS